MIKGEKIREEVIRHIERSMPWDHKEVRMDVELPPDQADLTEKMAIIRVETVGKEDYLGEMIFLVRISQGKIHRQITVRGTIELLKSVIVSARALPAGSVIGESDILVKKKWVTRLDPLLVSSPEEVVGKQLSTSLKAGMEIKRTTLTAPLLVKRGKTVRINLEKGPLKISTIGVSEEDGAQGALIRVRNISSNRHVYARVVGENLVQVEF